MMKAFGNSQTSHYRSGGRWVAMAPWLPTLAAALLLTFAPPARATWRIFTTADGLASNIVRGVLEDSNETLWFATWAGVSHYDGLTWRTFTRADGLVSDSVSCVMQARDGSFWFGAQAGGVSRFAGGTWQTYRPQDGPGIGTVNSISEDQQGRIWFATMGGGASWFDGTTWGKQTGLATEFIHSVFEDHAGNRWITTHNAGVYRCTGSTCTRFTATNSPIRSNDVISICEDTEHRIWLGTANGVVSLDSRGTWGVYTSDDGVPIGGILSILQDRAGHMWFGSVNGGLGRFDGRWWRRYNELDAYFSGSSVVAITQDRSGNLWLATNGGAARFDESELKTFPDVPILGSALVLGVSQDRLGDLWFGTDSTTTYPQGAGAFRYDGKDWTQVFADKIVPFPSQDQAGNHWFPIVYTGLLREDTFGQQTTFTTNDGLASNFSRLLLEDRKHNIWVAHKGGVSLYDGSTWTAFTPGNTPGMAATNFFGILEDREGSLWFGSTTGVCRRDTLGIWKTYTKANGLGTNFVLSMLQANDGSFWFTTPPITTADPGGISRFYGEPTPGGVEQITTANGLRNNSVLGATHTSDGSLWFTLDSGGGIARWDGTQWRGLGVEDGLPSGSCHLMLEDQSGDLWITTNKGVARYGRDVVPPRTIIPVRPPIISGSRSQSAIFGAIGESDRLEFSYRLDGGAWSPWSPINGWSAQDLADGLHVLEARSRDYWVNVDSTAEVAEFEIDATPPVPAITSPTFGAPARGVVEIHGTASDPRFLSYQILTRPSGASSWDPPVATIAHQSSTPVTNGVLATIDTSPLPDGLYDVRLSVTDSLGLQGVAQVSVVVDNHAPFFNETSPAKVTAALGGDVYTTNAQIHLYFPPHAFREDAIVMVAPLDRQSVSDTLAGGATLVDPGEEYSWSGGALVKPARLSVSYANMGPLPSGILAIYFSPDGATWERLGGTVDGRSKTIELAVNEPGRYALFADQGVSSGPRSLSSVSFSPRVFSPTGGYADREVGIAFTLGRPGAVTVRVYNRSGRLIREVLSGTTLGAGMNVIRWDGTDRSGLVVPDGVYLVSVEAFGQSQKKPLAVVR